MGSSASTAATTAGTSSQDAARAAANADGTVHIADEDEYARWTLPAVRAAWQRYEQIVAKPTPVSATTSADTVSMSPLLINRRQFWEIFTDYTVLVQGSFLSLSIKTFKLFAGSDSATFVFALEPFLVLTLFCDGVKWITTSRSLVSINSLLMEKVEFLFQMFDFGHKGHMSNTEANAAVKVGLLAVKPSVTTLEDLAAEMFVKADDNRDRTVSPSEFMQWGARTLMTREILNRLAAASRPASASPAKAVSAAAGRPSGIGQLPSIQQRGARPSASKPSARAVSSYAVVEATPLPEDVETIDAPPLARATSASLGIGGLSVDTTFLASSKWSFDDDLEGLIPAPSIPTVPPPMMRTRTPTPTYRPSSGEEPIEHQLALTPAMMRTRKSKLRMVASQKILRELANRTDFNLTQLNKLADQFVDKSDVTGKLDMGAFKALITASFPAIASDGVVQRVFQLFDTNSDGRVDFREFVTAMAKIVHGGVFEKLQLVFNIYDTDKVGSISIVQLTRLIRDGSHAADDLVEHAQDVLQSFDTNGDGKISRDEFIAALTSDAMILQVFSDCTSTLSIELTRRMQQLRTLCSEFSHANFLKLWGSLAADRRQLRAQLNLKAFRQFMLVNFGCGMDVSALVDLVFQAWSEELAGVVRVHDLMSGCAQILLSGLEEQSQFYFDYFDINGNGYLDLEEILHMLLQSQRKGNRFARKLLASVYSLDTDNSGRVCFEEFKECVSKDPTVMSSVLRLFASATPAQDGGFGDDPRGGGRIKHLWAPTTAPTAWRRSSSALAVPATGREDAMSAMPARVPPVAMSSGPTTTPPPAKDDTADSPVGVVSSAALMRRRRLAVAV